MVLGFTTILILAGAFLPALVTDGLVTGTTDPITTLLGGVHADTAMATGMATTMDSTGGITEDITMDTNTEYIQAAGRDIQPDTGMVIIIPPATMSIKVPGRRM